MTTFGGALRTRAARRLASRPAQQAAAQPPACGSWILTRRVPTTGRFDLFRARSAGEIGPGCYLIKRPRVSGSSIAEQLLAREATVSIAAVNPHLSSVLAHSRCNHGPFNVLPFLDGVALDRLLAVRSRFSVSQALALGRQIASALATLHAAGWLHGQVEPSHVLLSPQRQATLLNLTGTRRLESSECDVQPWPRASLPYLSPESFANHGRLTAAFDVYALGALIYEALAGRPPFIAASDRALIDAHRRQRPEDLQRWRSDVSVDVNELIRRMLMKEPLRRPGAAELMQWLVELEIAELQRRGHSPPTGATVAARRGKTNRGHPSGA